MLGPALCWDHYELLSRESSRGPVVAWRFDSISVHTVNPGKPRTEGVYSAIEMCESPSTNCLALDIPGKFPSNTAASTKMTEPRSLNA